jgi:hypothetical protein
MPDDADRDGPDHQPPPSSDKPPLLDYPSVPVPPDRDTERWSEVARALLVIFGVIGTLFFVVFGVCGGLARGCD